MNNIQQAIQRALSSSLSNAPPPPKPRFSDFKAAVYRHYKPARHLALLDYYLTQVTKFVNSGGLQGIGRLIVEMPPRHGKSTTISRLFPAWHLGLRPDDRFILASYSADLAVRHSRAARNIVTGKHFQNIFGDFQIAADAKAANAWNIQDREGGMDAIGLLGGASGKGAHVLIVDDAIKNRQEAESPLLRDRIWDGFQDDLMTRLEPSGAVIVVMTRWHTDDLVGRLLTRSVTPWARLRLPALAEQDDPLGRDVGEALWPFRYPVQRLAEIRADMGEYSWAALYQQNPVPSAGGLFRRATLEPALDYLPPLSYAVRFWDLAMSSKTLADYSVGVKMALGEDGHFYVVDVARAQKDWGDVPEWIAGVMMQDGAAVTQGIEQQGYMSRAIQDLNADPRLHGYQIFGFPKDVNKVTNALPFAARCGAGLVHVANTYWTQAYLDELFSFPYGGNDDQVDASAGAYAMLGSDFAGGALYNPQPLALDSGY